MKTWSKPQADVLTVTETRGGGNGGNGDGVQYNVHGYIVVGTSGAELPFPVVPK